MIVPRRAAGGQERETSRARVEADDLKHERDAHAREALEHGLGRRGVAKALCIDKITAQRRYGGRTETH